MNAKIKHTTGPWAYERMHIGPNERDRRCGFVVNAVAVDDGEGLPRRVCDMRVPVGMAGFSEGEANARLIAAAPELLAALEGAAKALGMALPFLPPDKESIYCGEWLGEVVEAIAKAKGTQ